MFPVSFQGSHFGYHICLKEIRRSSRKTFCFRSWPGYKHHMEQAPEGQWSRRDDGWTNMGCEISGEKVDMKEMI